MDRTPSVTACDDNDLERLQTGIAGLDAVLCGGLISGSVYLIDGPPGAGKSILANQICFNRAARGGRAVYVTLLAESHHRLLRNLHGMGFLDPEEVGDAVFFESGFDTLKEEGLEGVIHFLRRNSKANRASLIVVDGVFALAERSDSAAEFREFLNDLGALADLTGCTILLLTNSDRSSGNPEYTMVDGWIELDLVDDGERALRLLRVKKFRGSNFIAGLHEARIDDNGLRVFPRLEALESEAPAPIPAAGRVASGIRSLDEMIGGGVPTGSTTLLVGPTGVGKTSVGLEFICASSAAEPGLLFGFYEQGERLARRARALGHDLEALIDRGVVEVHWQAPTERILDELAVKLLEAVAARGVKRLFVDGVDALQQAAVNPARLGRFLTALTNRLRAAGVTALFSLEVPELTGAEGNIRLATVSALAENILLLRYVERDYQLRRALSVIKLRESGFDHVSREFYLTDNGVQLNGPLSLARPDGEAHG